jgi:hypothetical protein
VGQPCYGDGFGLQVCTQVYLPVRRSTSPYAGLPPRTQVCLFRDRSASLGKTTSIGILRQTSAMDRRDSTNILKELSINIRIYQLLAAYFTTSLFRDFLSRQIRGSTISPYPKMKLLTPALLLASPLLAEAACRFEFWQYDNFPDNNYHAYMVRTDVFGDNMNFPKMIDDFCSIFRSKFTCILDPTKPKTVDYGPLTLLFSPR